MGIVRVGTCSWTDKTMIEAWYPRRVSSAEDRLRYYAARFDTVEADSTFYALPDPSMARRWVERTPERFLFHVKAYGLMTGHDVDAKMMHPALASFPHELTSRGRVRRPHPDMVDAAFDLFRAAVDPLVEAGKMGGVLMQFPPWFTAERAKLVESLDRLEHAAEKLDGLRMLVEFRHPSWVADGVRESMLRFLADRGMSYVSVDAPQFESRSTMPPLALATTDLAYVRLHGRNTDTYYRRTESAADRFDYLYSHSELAEWEQPVRDLASATETTFVMFNNCKYDYAPRNAREMAAILGDVSASVRDGVMPGEPADPTGEGRLF